MNVSIFLKQPPTKCLAYLFLLSFTLRAATFYFFIAPGNYFKQPDSMDYHNCAVSIAAGAGMHRIDNHEPIFWRTPGYPQFLARFYNWAGLRSARFEDNRIAHMAAIWIQILLSSFIPIILLFLAHLLTQSWLVANLVGILSCLHIGLVLAGTFLLTEGIALLFFYLFLLFLYRLIFHKTWFFNLFGTVTSLSIYTWMRPHGEVIAIGAAIAIACTALGNWKQKIAKSLLFFVMFFATLFPWYWRNYGLTQEFFFCPTSGPYLNSFSAPKILRRVTGKPILECHQLLQRAATLEVRKKRESLQYTGLYASPLTCKKIAVPLIKKYPGYFLYDWLMEVLKTTFDLYSYQLVSIANGSFFYDPIEEFLPDKVAAVLWQEKIPLTSRIIGWLELLFSLFLWVGLLFSFVTQFFLPLFSFNQLTASQKRAWRTWFAAGLLISAAILPSGGFGYARLRLPVEPLLIILALAFWVQIYLSQIIQRKQS